MMHSKCKVALLHAAGYAGRELARILLGHPRVTIDTLTSRTFAGRPIWVAYPSLRGESDHVFTAPDDLDLCSIDAVFVSAEHGKAAPLLKGLIDEGYDGAVIDLSADFRFRDPRIYNEWFGHTHPAPELLANFTYGLVEIRAPYGHDSKWIANPGCFATGISLSLWPLAKNLSRLEAAVTALTGASGSGTRPTETTHYPTRDGNVRAYKILIHQHLPEILQILGPHADVAFVPVSGPWTKGIWGTAHVTLPKGITAGDVASWYHSAYGSARCIRLWPNALPELRYAAGTPYCDIGFVERDGQLVVGFALDNLLKGAASQAVQNLNLLMGWPDTMGLFADA